MPAIFLLAAVAAISAPGEAVLVQFSSQRCQHCQAMQPVVAQLASQGVQVHTIDVDQQLEVARQYKIQGVPTYVIVAGGQEVGRIEGVTTNEKLTALLSNGGNKTSDSTAQIPPPAPAGGALSGLPADQVAKAATVRIKVEDTSGYGYGTGTIIDTHDREALVITCGHLFRESQGQGKITADLFSSGASQTVPGQLIAYDLDRDVALISLTGVPPARPVRIAPPGYTVRPGEPVFTIGCDKGAEPSIRSTHITAVNKYQGKPNLTAAGQPVDGRSGGGLFTADGQLLGICNAADPSDDEGLYAGLASIHWQLDKIGQSMIYQRAAQQGLAKSSPPAASETSVAPAAYSQPLAATPSSPQLPTNNLAPLSASDDTEIVFIVRSKKDPGQRSEVFVVDQVPPDLLARITREAQASGERRAAVARLDAAPHVAAAPPLR